MAAEASQSGRSAGRGRRWAWVLLALLLAAGVAGLVLVMEQPAVQRPALTALAWVKGLGGWGWPVFVGLCLLAMVVLFSSSVMSVAGGALFGLTAGFAATWLGCGLGGCVAFGLGRTCLRGLVARKLAGHPKLAALDRALDAKGFKVVLLARLASLPAGVGHYLFSLTSVRFGPFVLGTMLGMAPRMLWYVYLGTLAGKLTDRLRRAEGIPGGSFGLIYAAASLAVVAALLLFVGRLARKALAEAVGPGPGAGQH